MSPIACRPNKTQFGSHNLGIRSPGHIHIHFPVCFHYFPNVTFIFTYVHLQIVSSLVQPMPCWLIGINPLPELNRQGPWPSLCLLTAGELNTSCAVKQFRMIKNSKLNNLFRYKDERFAQNFDITMSRILVSGHFLFLFSFISLCWNIW